MASGRKKKQFGPGDDLALVYEQYQPELKGYVARRVGSPEETEDIVQDVFYNLARIDLLESPIEYLSAWLYQAATNRIIDRGRKKKEVAMPETRDNDEDEYFLGTLSSLLADDDPEEAFRNEVIKDEIEQALSELPAEQRIVFEFTEYDGIPYKDISESTGIPVATLLSRKHYAVTHLRKRLRKIYDDLLAG